MSELIIELGCEELPAAAVMPMAQHLGTRLTQVLHEAGLCDDQARVFATPRRLAVYFQEVSDRQPDTEVERRGPAVKSAYHDGVPTKALEGFLRSAGVTADQLSTVQTAKGEWVTVRLVQHGRHLGDVLSDALPEIFKNMPMPRRMRWGQSSHEFLRPVSWLLVLHGATVLPVKLFGLSAGNTTRGHRFHAPEPIVLTRPGDYEPRLEAAKVMADPSRRRHVIEQAVHVEATKLGGVAVVDEELLDEVTALVEWPVALSGRFDAQFLEIPKEALIQTMQENQRYFALLDTEGALMPAFITIANLESVNPATVVDGNERVIRPRFADTMFFWNQDKRQPLSAHQPQLARLLFQESLGSVADKVSRMITLAEWLSARLSYDASEVVLAVSLCKCDLNTEIVKELPKMQGICGRYYAERDAHPASVCEAMEQHYFPNRAGGPLPAGRVAQIVALADKIDTLTGIFGLGLKPTGTRDPFGLRRASLGVVRIVVEQELDLDLGELIDEALGIYGSTLEAPDRQAMLAYVIERMRGYLLEHGYAADVVDSVLAKGLTRPLDIMARLAAVEQFRHDEVADSLSAASKRISNLLRKVDGEVPTVVNEGLMREAAERELLGQLQIHRPAIESCLQAGNYAAAMRETALLRESVDAFFDQVMVMDDDPATRANRLALLQQVNTLCCATAELGLLQSVDTAS